MRLNNGSGDVVPNSLRLLKKNVAQGMAAMLHANGQDFWLMSLNVTGDSLQAFPVTAAGIGSPVVSLTSRSLEPMSWIKSAPNSEQMVTTGRQGIELFSFNRSTGAVAPLYSLTIPDSARQQAYCYSFSPSSTKLYVGTLSRPGNNLSSIVQYDLAAGSQSQVQQSAVTIYRRISQSTLGGIGSDFITDMQLAIDGSIYVSRQDTTLYLSRISYPDQDAAACGFKLRAVKMGMGWAYSLPALNQTLFRNTGKLQALAMQDTICFGDSVQLSAYGAGAGRFRWQLASGLSTPSDTLANPVVRPAVTTTYMVTGFSPFKTDTAFVKVVVLNKTITSLTGPAQVYTLAENQEYKVLTNTNSGSNLVWKVAGGEIVSGQGTGSIKVNWADAGAGLVEVTEINRKGCPGGSLSLPVQVAGSPKPVFSNIFTPNGDGYNENFTIGNLKWYPENELRIFTRWGKQVYQKSNYRNNWNGSGLSSGIYYYLFRSGNQNWKGWIEILH